MVGATIVSICNGSRILANAGSKRSPFAPDIPTAREGSVDFVAELWWGLATPAGTAPAQPAPDTAAHTNVIRGKALIFWDRKSPVPKKLDAIDTDQITPSADCVSADFADLAIRRPSRRGDGRCGACRRR